MVRSFWIVPPMIALALTVSAWGQSAAPAPASASPGERVITVQEMGKPGQQCRVLRSWLMADGTRAYQVQALQTGEMMTIVESGALAMPSTPGRPAVRAVATRIFHWGRSGTPPKNCPMPPEVNPSIVPVAGVMPSDAVRLPAGPAVPSPMPSTHSTHTPAPPPPAMHHPEPVHEASACDAHGLPAAQKLKSGDTRVTLPSGPPCTYDREIRTSKPSLRERLGFRREPKEKVVCPPAFTHPPVAERMKSGDTRVHPKSAPAACVTEIRTTRPGLGERLGIKRPVEHAAPAAVLTHTPVAEKMYPTDTRIHKKTPTPASGHSALPGTTTIKAVSSPVRSRYVPGAAYSTDLRPSKPSLRERLGLKRSPKNETVVSEPGSAPYQVPPPPMPVAEPTKVEQQSAAAPPWSPLPAGGAASNPTRKKIRKSPTAPSKFATTREESAPLPTTTTVSQNQPIKRATLRERLRNEPIVPTTGKPAVASASKVPAEVARPGDHRQSWGKPDSKPAVGATPPARTERTFLRSKSSNQEETLPYSRKSKGNDPLINPEAYSNNVPARSTPATAARAETKVAPAARKPKPGVQAARGEIVPPPPPPPVPAPSEGPSTPTTTTVAKPATGSNPPGTGSVMASGSPQYVPVPIVTVPQLPPPTPPTPQIPQAPALNRMVNSAYQAGNPSPGMVNAFTNPGPERPIPSETAPREETVNAFGSSEGGPMPPPQYPSMPAPAVAGGYPYSPQGYAPSMPAMPMQPSAQMAAQQMAAQQMMAQQMAAQQGWGNAAPGVARIPIMPVSYTPASYYGGPMAAMPNPASAGYPQDASGVSTAQMMQMLADSDYPSQREWAAEQMSGLNWRSYPQVVQSLATAARTDPAPMVRACCVRSLMKMQANTMPVITVVQDLKNDPDPRVRDAVTEALVSFGISPTQGSQPIQPVSGPEPKNDR